MRVQRLLHRWEATGARPRARPLLKSQVHRCGKPSGARPRARPNTAECKRVQHTLLASTWVREVPSYLPNWNMFQGYVLNAFEKCKLAWGGGVRVQRTWTRTPQQGLAQHSMLCESDSFPRMSERPRVCAPALGIVPEGGVQENVRGTALSAWMPRAVPFPLADCLREAQECSGNAAP